VATVNGEPRRIFGWQDSSHGPRYRAFLLSFLPQLVSFLRHKGILDRCFLHTSDEPGPAHLADYGQVREILRQGAPELKTLDALSNLDFYRAGYVDIPCPANNHAQPFLEARVPGLWTYYCCSQQVDVANRFMDFPRCRNRILGWQLFKFRFAGFLQWGYNYWLKQLTDRLVDPYRTVDAGNRLPPGDAFVVYPGADGPVDSVRWEVFREGLQDMRALRWLESLIEGHAGDPAAALVTLPDIQSMLVYPRDPGWLRQTRLAVNRAIDRLSG